MKKIMTCLLVLLGWGLSCSVSAESVAIYNLGQSSDVVGQYEKFEITLEATQTYENPFDLDLIEMTVIFHQPDGSNTTVPCFFYREYEVSGSNPEEYIHPGPPLWKARFAPELIGDYSFSISVTDSAGSVLLSPAGTFRCVPSDSRGKIGFDVRDVTRLAYQEGSPRINIGHNVCWLTGGIATWQEYFDAMNAAGENWTRIWMCPFGGQGGVILEYPENHSSGYFDGPGRLSMQIAQRLDRIIELAEQNGIAIQLVLQYHGAFSSTVDSNWSSNPYNEATGGFLTDPAQFFTDTEARRMTRNKYRYIIARWGYSPAILAWELWNEVQFTDGWKTNPSAVVTWHQEMADFIHGTDPFDHLVTTSSDTSGFENIWTIPTIDLVQLHHYHGSVIPAFVDAAERLSRYGKPVLMGEFGAGSVGNVNPAEVHPEELPEPYRSQIYDALVLHNGIWAAFHANSSGHLWWWDSYIHKLDLYNHFLPLAIYAAGEDPAAHGLTTAPQVIQGEQSVRATPGLTDFWAVSAQTEFILTGNDFPGVENLSQWLHGQWKSDYRSNPSFQLTMNTPGFLVIHVVKVSDYGSNSLRIRIDGDQVFSSTYTNGSSNFQIRVPLSAGQQTVKIENTGQDWFHIAGYEFAPEHESMLDSIGLAGPHRAYLWIYDKGSQFGQASNGTFENETIRLEGLEDGEYDVHVYNTRSPGGLIHTERIFSENGELTCTLPAFERDIALKILPV
ncbi:MAG: DUF5060 domain-containing protein, partial [Sedimentisphaerales bacterium]|nr:DUF5060 domain-containing protein [Sedimentisphaerales bacterium]